MDAAAAREPRWTPLFARLPEEKRRRVLDCAKAAFARYGYAGTNVNRIAEEADISVGALYKYFRTKDELFLALIEGAYELLDRTVAELFARHAGFYERLEALLRAAVDSAREDPDLVRLYLACTTDELSGLAERLSGRLESISAERYRALVAEAAARGEIAPVEDPGAAAFILDDLLLLLQFSYASSYYRERLRLFVGPAALEDPEALVASCLSFLRRAFG